MSQGVRPPDGTARRSQLLLGAGPGALVDLIEDAVIIGGLDAWRYRRETDGFIVEPRLQARAQTMLSEMTWWPHADVRLRLPPECDGDEPSPAAGIAVGRFPRWFLCQSPDCRSIVPVNALDKPALRYHTCQHDKRKSYPVVPIRFVAACVSGHLQDINWQWFVHRTRAGEQVGEHRGWCVRKPGANRAGDPLGEEWTAELTMLQVGTSGELADFIVSCRKCGARRGLQDLAQQGLLGHCQGRRPWLGYGADEPCDLPLKLLTRTASNAYFPNPISVLSIPDPALLVREKVETVWDFIKVATQDTLPVFRQLPNVAEHLAGLTDAEVLAELDRRRLGLPVTMPPIRETEWGALMAAPPEAPGDHPGPQDRWFARRLSVELPDFLDRIVLVKHLTEVRGQIGFTRIEPIVGDAEGDYDPRLQMAPLARYASWIPAVEIPGEGVFIAFDAAYLDRWTDPRRNPAVARRAASFVAGFKAFNATRAQQVDFPGLRLVMLHTLSHLLINSISLECGYAASSIRERLYCAVERDRDGRETTRRAGILLYTGSPGSEGTLGGLVEVGRNLLHHLRRAAELAMLCSNDPVCASHSPDDDQEGRYREGAACHGCVLIGEPSCERMNQDLDRSLVVPTVHGDPEAAFLGPWLASWR